LKEKNMAEEALNMKSNEKAVRMFKELVSIKRQQTELKDKYDALKEYFKAMAEEKLEGGTGEIELLNGAGVKFATKKSSISKKKLVELGVSEEIVEKATGEYVAFEVYSG